LLGVYQGGVPVARMLFVGTCGSENPTKSVLPFLSAKGALEAGHQPQVALVGDAVVLMKDVVANAVVPVGWPPLRELLNTALEQGTPIYV
jgi:predicted peroxiredoxin